MAIGCRVPQVGDSCLQRRGEVLSEAFSWVIYGILLDERESRRLRHMKAEKFDKKFDKGEDVTKYLDFSKARRPGRAQRRVNVDFLIWMIQCLDKEAQRLGVARQALIKMVIAQHIEKAHT